MTEQSSKSVRLSGHARDQLIRRGVTEEEVVTAIRTATWQSATGGRLECRLDFSFERLWKKTVQYQAGSADFCRRSRRNRGVTVYSYYF